MNPNNNAQLLIFFSVAGLLIVFVAGEFLWTATLTPNARANQDSRLGNGQTLDTLAPTITPSEVPFPDLSLGYTTPMTDSASIDLLLDFGDEESSKTHPVTEVLEGLVSEGSLDDVMFHYGAYEEMILNTQLRFNQPNPAGIGPEDPFIMLAGNANDLLGSKIHTYTVSRRFIPSEAVRVDELDRICFPSRFTSSASLDDPYPKDADLEIQYIVALLLVLQGDWDEAALWLDEGNQSIQEIWDAHQIRLENEDLREIERERLIQLTDRLLENSGSSSISPDDLDLLWKDKIDERIAPQPGQTLMHAVQELTVLNLLLSGQFSKAASYTPDYSLSRDNNTEHRIVLCREHNQAFALHAAGQLAEANRAYSKIIDAVESDRSYSYEAYPAHFLARYNRALTWIELEEYQMARSDLEECYQLRSSISQTPQFLQMLAYMEAIGYPLFGVR